MLPFKERTVPKSLKMASFGVKTVDLELETNIEKVVEILKTVGFDVIELRNDKIIEAKLKDGWGRIHLHGIAINEAKTYLDIHRDAPIHVAFIGVDYSRRPQKICRKIIRHAQTTSIRGKITGGTSWFNRKNKALLKGIKLEVVLC